MRRHEDFIKVMCRVVNAIEPRIKYFARQMNVTVAQKLNMNHANVDSAELAQARNSLFFYDPEISKDPIFNRVVSEFQFFCGKLMVRDIKQRLHDFMTFLEGERKKTNHPFKQLLDEIYLELKPVNDCLLKVTLSNDDDKVELSIKSGLEYLPEREFKVTIPSSSASRPTPVHSAGASPKPGRKSSDLMDCDRSPSPVPMDVSSSRSPSPFPMNVSSRSPSPLMGITAGVRSLTLGGSGTFKPFKPLAIKSSPKNTSIVMGSAGSFSYTTPSRS